MANTLNLEFDIDTGKQENLNPKGVNCIRRFPGRGVRVWGARTLASDPMWKYVNVRRLFIFLETSIYYSTQWVVFEPNDQRLWARFKPRTKKMCQGSCLPNSRAIVARSGSYCASPSLPRRHTRSCIM